MYYSLGKIHYKQILPEIIIYDSDKEYMCGIAYTNTLCSFPIVVQKLCGDKETINNSLQKYSRNNYYMVEDSSLALILYESLEVGDYIKNPHYRAVARILAHYLYDTGQI